MTSHGSVRHSSDCTGTHDCERAPVEGDWGSRGFLRRWGERQTADARGRRGMGGSKQQLHLGGHALSPVSSLSTVSVCTRCTAKVTCHSTLAGWGATPGTVVTWQLLRVRELRGRTRGRRGVGKQLSRRAQCAQCHTLPLVFRDALRLCLQSQ